MSQLPSQPAEITAENLSQSPLSAGSAWAREKRFADVLGRRMAYIERGVGHPIVFLHGNPTSSFLWRGVLPHVEAAGRRLIAPDLIGMGDSDKIPVGTEPDRYRFASHARYLDAFIDEVAGTEPLTLVLHDWGGGLGFDWAYRPSAACTRDSLYGDFRCAAHAGGSARKLPSDAEGRAFVDGRSSSA
jgi:pimeloyl-ACP methyl ester carboxylesterase